MEKLLNDLQELCSKYDVIIEIKKDFIWINKIEGDRTFSRNLRLSVGESVEEICKEVVEEFNKDKSATHKKWNSVFIVGGGNR